MIDNPDGTKSLVLLKMIQERRPTSTATWRENDTKLRVFDNFLDARKFVYEWLNRMMESAHRSPRINIEWTHHLERTYSESALHPERVMPTITVEWSRTTDRKPYKRYVIGDMSVGTISYSPAQKEENENQSTE
jgi:hypothetical protein